MDHVGAAPEDFLVPAPPPPTSWQVPELASLPPAHLAVSWSHHLLALPGLYFPL